MSLIICVSSVWDEILDGHCSCSLEILQIKGSSMSTSNALKNWNSQGKVHSTIVRVFPEESYSLFVITRTCSYSEKVNRKHRCTKKNFIYRLELKIQFAAWKVFFEFVFRQKKMSYIILPEKVTFNEAKWIIKQCLDEARDYRQSICHCNFQSWN